MCTFVSDQNKLQLESAARRRTDVHLLTTSEHNCVDSTIDKSGAHIVFRSNQIRFPLFGFFYGSILG